MIAQFIPMTLYEAYISNAPGGTVPATAPPLRSWTQAIRHPDNLRGEEIGVSQQVGPQALSSRARRRLVEHSAPGQKPLFQNVEDFHIGQREREPHGQRREQLERLLHPAGNSQPPDFGQNVRNAQPRHYPLDSG